MTLPDAPQGSEAWRQARCGSVGASDAPRVVRRTKTGYSADRESLMADKLLERLTDTPVEIFKTQAMLQGTAREPEARMLYQMVRGVEVEEVGLVTHPTIKGTHASPDGYVLVPFETSIAGLIEIKCPLPAKHLDTLLNETISNDHMVQMQWQMACTDRPWCDYVSFNPDFPAAMQLWIKRVARDQSLIGELHREIAQFIRELEQKVERLSRRYAVAA
jgi:putative phage-type endonuclease